METLLRIVLRRRGGQAVTISYALLWFDGVSQFAIQRGEDMKSC